ncbi:MULTISPECIES: hypothetical protein [Microbacterium]|uniref:helix-turn-helix domain-containing protein n=1 Tax=Microbacterium TaxID=33882 RepID=UPI00278589EC|nr:MULTISPECIES: hypothetical protein [Microbacterium]MDQ1076213.1 transcriptional regulator with XRE-family HTH domain [Microbacterium sp. SORGH_AS_0969]MDQ1116450.1 transcriptional regulator with XRE-family HTH domain [Microbacterium testaceum]
MIDPEDADLAMSQHFDLISPPEKKLNAKPSDLNLDLVQGHPVADETVATTLRSIAPASHGVALDAYLACALTGLNDEQYEHISLLSDRISMICGERDISLYQPRLFTDPVHNPDISAHDVFRLDRDKVVASDLLIVLSHHASFGAGQELDFAHNAMVPIIIIAPSTKRVSRMVTGIPGLVVKIEYTDPEHLRDELSRQLDVLRPLLVQRHLQFSRHRVNVIGERIRQAREAAGLTRAELALSSQSLPGDASVNAIAESMVQHWEESTDSQSNLSVIQLREIAVLLNVSAAELIEPNIEGLYLSFVNSLFESAASDDIAARWGQYSTKDKKRLIMRLLERFGIELGLSDDR